MGNGYPFILTAFSSMVNQCWGPDKASILVIIVRRYYSELIVSDMYQPGVRYSLSKVIQRIRYFPLG